MLKRQTVGIVGAGQVGMAAAYALFIQKSASKLILIDVNKKRAEGEAMDLMHAQAYVGRCDVDAGDYSDLEDAQMVVVSAGVSQKPGETRLELLNRNAEIFREIAVQLDRYAPNAILLIATNPVDILTYVMQSLSQRPSNLIIGTGTMLDTTRFRTLLGEYYNVDPRSVHAFILGEHGDSEVPIWSAADIAGTRLITTLPLPLYHLYHLYHFTTFTTLPAWPLYQPGPFTQQELVRTQVDQLNSIVQIYRTLGGGWRQQETNGTGP